MVGVMTGSEGLDVVVTRVAGSTGRIALQRLLSLTTPEAAIL